MNAGDMSFSELAKTERATVFATAKHTIFPLEGLIMRGGASLCAYIGFPLWHPLANMSYDDIPLEVHGGLTFADKGHGQWPEGKYWIGWDYAHAGDKCFYDLDWHHAAIPGFNEKEWLVEEVAAELKEATNDFVWLFLFGWIGVRFRLALRRFSYSR